MRPQTENQALTANVLELISKGKVMNNNCSVGDFEGMKIGLSQQGTNAQGKTIKMEVNASFLPSYFAVIKPEELIAAYAKPYPKYISGAYVDGVLQVVITLPPITQKLTEEQIAEFKALASHAGTLGNFILTYPITSQKSCAYSLPSADVLIEAGTSVKVIYTFKNSTVILVQLLKDLASLSKLQKTYRMIFSFQMNAKNEPELTAAVPKDAPQLADIAMIPTLTMQRASWEEAWMMNRMRKTCGELVETIRAK